MSQRHVLLSVLVWFMGLFVAYSQTDSSLVYIRVRLISAETKEAVPYAHVVLLSNYWGLASDNAGEFETSFPQHDTLLISSIGFEHRKIIINELIPDSCMNIIELQPKSYMLTEVKITQYPTYEELVQAIINPVYSEDEKRMLIAYENLKKMGFSQRIRSIKIKKRPMIIPLSPITTLYNLFSREEKYLRKYSKLKIDDQNKESRNKKFNVKIVEHLTGLSDSLVALQFIEYCNFSKSFLNNSSEYELYSLILKKYEEFILRKQKRR